ncbi:MAG: DNA primase catalytic subunit PriS [Candidatus Micrarchaeota archaeon]
MYDFIIDRLKEYYRDADLEILKPETREFGIGNRKKIDARHLSFNSIDTFRTYLASNTPLFTSHSTAYYRYPDATPIEKKDWMGADLVFDLDLHTKGKYEIYKKLPTVKEDAIRLMEEILVADFGIKKKNLMLVFSGNRGYHIHVREEEYLDLRSDERKEIVDYVQGTGMNYENFFERIEVPGTKITKLIGPTPFENGYRGRFARETIKKLSGISRKFKKENERANAIKGIEQGNWSVLDSVKDLMPRLEEVAKELPLKSVETDSGVTQDISKLIRVPNSIHGETGMIAKVVRNIESFDPMKDALLTSTKEIKIKFTEDIENLEIGNETLEFKKDETKELKENVAIFFLLKGSAVTS